MNGLFQKNYCLLDLIATGIHGAVLCYFVTQDKWAGIFAASVVYFCIRMLIHIANEG